VPTQEAFRCFDTKRRLERTIRRSESRIPTPDLGDCDLGV